MDCQVHLKGTDVLSGLDAGRPVTARAVDPGVPSMAEGADNEYQKLLWDAALESMGRDTVRIRLNNMPAGPLDRLPLPGSA